MASLSPTLPRAMMARMQRMGRRSVTGLPGRAGPRARSVRVAVTAVVAVTALVLAGCGVRLDTEPLSWPSPDADTLLRDAAALREQQVIDARELADADGRSSVLAATQVGTAEVRLAMLGGVYDAFPDATAEPAVTPSDPAGPLSLEDAMGAARDGALAHAQAASDGNLAALLNSIGLSHALASWYASWSVSWSSGAQTEVVAERLLPSPVVDATTPMATGAHAAPEVMADLALTHDQLRHLYEVAAARSTPADEDDDPGTREWYLSRRDAHASRADALTEFAQGLDHRESLYAIPADSLLDDISLRVAVIAAEETLAETYASLLVDGWAEQAWLLSAAFDAYAQAAVFTVVAGEDWTVPALPGIETVNGLS